LKNYEHEVSSKVWNGALTLGVEELAVLVNSSKVDGSGKGVSVDFIKEIKDNEKRDEIESSIREHHKSVYQ
jgi:hypothetical protein